MLLLSLLLFSCSILIFGILSVLVNSPIGFGWSLLFLLLLLMLLLFKSFTLFDLLDIFKFNFGLRKLPLSPDD